MVSLTPLFVFLLVSVSAFSWEDGGDRPIRKLEITAQVDSCSVMTTRGLVSLHPLDKIQKGGNKPAFDDYMPAGSPASFSYNPCSPFTVDLQQAVCKNVAVCQYYNNGNNAGNRTKEKKDSPKGTYQLRYAAGSQGSATFGTDGEKLWVEYDAIGIEGINRVSKITLVCKEGIEGKFAGDGEVVFGSAQFFFTLTSKYVCPMHMRDPTTISPLPTRSTTHSPTHSPVMPGDRDVYRVIMFSLLGFIALLMLTLVCITCAVLGRLAGPQRKKYTPPAYLIQTEKI